MRFQLDGDCRQTITVNGSLEGKLTEFRRALEPELGPAPETVAQQQGPMRLFEGLVVSSGMPAAWSEAPAGSGPSAAAAASAEVPLPVMVAPTAVRDALVPVPLPGPAPQVPQASRRLSCAKCGVQNCRLLTCKGCSYAR